MHKLLKKQLKKLGYENGELPQNQINKFIELVSNTYIEADDEREFLEHTLEVSSAEMMELFEELKQKSQTALAKSEKKYKELAKKDALTGVLNRFAFHEELRKLISSARRTKSKFAVLFLDLDHFKEVNDLYGHAAGDTLLKEVVSRVLPNIRCEDIFARFGGDEFVLILTNIKDDTIKELVEKAIHLFRKPWLVNNQKLNITTSVGISIFPDDADTENKLVSHADKAMYKSKELGRNQVVYYNHYKDLI